MTVACPLPMSVNGRSLHRPVMPRATRTCRTWRYAQLAARASASAGEGRSQPPTKSSDTAEISTALGNSLAARAASSDLTRRALLALTVAVPALVAPLEAPHKASAASTLANPVFPVAAEPAAPEISVAPRCPPGSTVELTILDGSKLGVAYYPDFTYNPSSSGGGGGLGTAEDTEDGRIALHFDPESLDIPPLQVDTTQFLALPLPPSLSIRIEPQALDGFLDPTSGKIDLTFIASFYFSIGSLYKAPPLLVATNLTTETSAGRIRSTRGQRLDASGACQLAGIARIAPVGDPFLDVFLGLPTDVLALLPAHVTFKPAPAPQLSPGPMPDPVVVSVDVLI